jgi:hypothetical protein
MKEENYSLYTDGHPGAIALEIFRLAQMDLQPSVLSLVAMFSNQRNWKHARLDDGSHKWVWVGPTIPPWELPEQVFKAQTKD